MDKENLKIIIKLQKLCNGNYKVFDYSELSETLGIKVDALKNDLQHLKNNEYLDIKYSDESVVCLTLLPKARQLKEENEAKTYSHKNIMKVLLLSGVFNGIMAFLGALVALVIMK